MTKDTLNKPSSLGLKTDRAFFRALREKGALSRAAISQITGISKPTVSESAQRLLARSLIVPCDARDTSGSRRPAALYEINKARGCSVSIALEEHSSQIKLCDFQGIEINSEVVSYPQTRNQQQFIDDLIVLIKTTVASSAQALLAMSISVADPVHPLNGAVVCMPNSPFPLAHAVDFAELLSTQFDCAITVDNDVNWATLAEHISTDLDNFIYLYLGRGIGSGLFIEQRLIRGSDGMAGEIGYMKLAGDKTLLGHYYNAEFIEQASANNIAGQSAVVAQIGNALAASCNILNPATVVLGGPLAQSSTVFNNLEEHLQKGFLSTSVVLSALPSNAPLHGAAIGAHELALSSLSLFEPSIDREYRGYTRF